MGIYSIGDHRGYRQNVRSAAGLQHNTTQHGERSLAIGHMTGSSVLEKCSQVAIEVGYGAVRCGASEALLAVIQMVHVRWAGERWQATRFCQGIGLPSNIQDIQGPAALRYIYGQVYAVQHLANRNSRRYPYSRCNHTTSDSDAWLPCLKTVVLPVLAPRTLHVCPTDIETDHSDSPASLFMPP